MKHSTSILWLMTLIVFSTHLFLGQPVSETRIENKALMNYKLLDGFPRSTESNLVSFAVKNAGKLSLQKTVFPAVTLPGDTVIFSIVVRNIGTAAVANVQVLDTVSKGFSLVRVNQGQVQDSIVSRTWNRLDAGSVDTLILVAKVLSSVTQGSILRNAAYGRDSVGTTIVSRATLTVATMPHYVITKSAFPKPAVAGDTLTYTIHYVNNGNATGTGVRIYDAVPDGTQFVSASNNGSVTSRVVSWDIGTLTAGASGSVQMKVTIPIGLQNGSSILNTGMLNANGGVSISSNQDVTTVRGIIPGRITLTPNPRLLIGNGKDKSIMTVSVTDTLGRPVPDGTPVTMTTSAGKFGNGQQTIVLSTLNGFASTSLVADLVSTAITKAIASATAGTAGAGTVTDVVTIIFYPGAITGRVTDNRTGRAVDGAAAEVRTNTGQVVGIDTTKSGNPYLVPVARTDTFRTRVSAIDAFGSPAVSSNSVFVDVPGIGGVPPVPNSNSIGGSVYDMATGNRLAASRLLISRFALTGTFLDSVRTDLSGAYVFNKVPPGHHKIVFSTQYDTASVTVNNLADGEFRINADLGVVTARPELKLIKAASADTVLVGDSVRYVLRYQNSGTVVLKNVIIRDTLPSSLTILSISGNYQRHGNVIVSLVPSLPIGASDSLCMTVRLQSDLPNAITIMNSASSESDQTPRRSITCGIVTKVIVPNRSCRVALTSTPSHIIGNGLNASVIQAFLSDTLGNPKPDGTPVTFRATSGFFSNGKNTIIVPTKNGRVVDSVRALIVSSSIDTSFITVSIDDPQVCSASNSIMVVFYPGAITGVVRNRKTQQPVENALIQVYSSARVLVGSARTKADGTYLVPVPTTDRYKVVIATTNEFGKSTTATMNVSVAVPGTGGNPPTVGDNQIAGSIFYYVSNRPIPAAGITLLLNAVTANASPKQGSLKASASSAAMDSTVTDSTGAYLFANIAPGTYEVSISHPWIQGKDTVKNVGGGELVINVNLPVVLNPLLTFSKQGPAQAAPGDTALYTITAGNSGTLSLTNVVIVDTLDASMKFINASNPGAYESASHRIVWNVGTLTPGSQILYSVRAAFADTIHATFTAQNRASITSNEILPTRTQTSTRVYVPTNLQIWKTSSTASAQPGDTVTYVISVENAAGATSDSIRILDALPAQVRFLAAAPLARYDSSAHLLRWFIDSLKVGHQWQAVVKTIVRSDLPAGEITYTNTADLVWRDTTISSTGSPRSSAQVTTVISYLQVSKQAIRKIVDIGDFAGYVIRVTNISSASSARSVILTDRIPFGFAYVAGSSMLDTARLADPTGRQELRWHLTDSLMPNTTRTFSYRLVVGAGASEGTGVNTAQAYATTSTGAALVSAVVSERVEVRRGVFTDRGLIVGKVFYDDNRNLMQDEGEEGVKNVELMMEDGTRIITGDDGKYSLPDVPPGQHVIKVRQHTLPEGAELIAGYGAFAHDPSSRFVKLTESNIARADFYLTRQKAVQKDSLSASMHVATIGTVRLQRMTEPRNIVFIEDERRSPLRLTGVQFEVGKAILKQSAMDIVRELGNILRDYPDQSMWIAGHTDSVRMKTKEFPSNQALSLGRAEAVKLALVRSEGIDSSRIRTIGYGPDRPLASNKTTDGRAKNRRVEFYFGGSTEPPKSGVASVLFRIPISYDGSVPLQRIEIHDVLDTLYHYAEGSATIGDEPITPSVDGMNLHWTIDSIGTRYHKTLTYRAIVFRPDSGMVTAQSHSTVKYVVRDSVIVNDQRATTTNTVGVAVRGKAVSFVFSGVYFEVGKAILRPLVLSVLKDAGEVLRSDPGTIATVEGHTDTRPIHTAEFSSNVELSRARATQVIEYLLKDYGIGRERLEAHGWGSLRPIAANGTAEGRQANRRVEIKIYKNVFLDESLREGLIDSSEILQRKFIPTWQDVRDTSVACGPGEELLLTLETAQRVGVNTQTVHIDDSLSPYLSLEPKSASLIHGIDTVMNQETELNAACSKTESSSMITYRVTILPAAEGMKEFQHSAFIESKQNDGTIVRTRSTPVLIRMQKK